MRLFIFTTAAIFALSGCVAQKPIEWSALGGSNADGTVKLGYTYKYGTPNPEISQAIHLAKSRCVSWGYASAEAFGGETKTCQGERKSSALLGDSCSGEWQVIKEFQCTGQSSSGQKRSRK